MYPFNSPDLKGLYAFLQGIGRGSVIRFVMATPASLGSLQYLRIWHDNSGGDNDASWFLSRIVVQDLHTQHM